MKNRLLLFSSIAAIAVFSCKPDPKTAQWDTEALTPLVSTRIDITDIVTDSSLSVGTDNLLSLYYRDGIAELLPDEIITPISRNFTNTVNLQSIDLGTRRVSDALSLGEMAQGGTPAGQFIINNNGNTAISPPFPNVGPKSFVVDGTEFFESINLIDGTLEVSFDNQLPVALTEIEFRLENRISGDKIIESSIDTLRPMQTLTESFSLANQTIEGELVAILEHFTSPGSGTQPVPIDTSDQVVVSLVMKDLNPSSATAIFPDQNIVNDTIDNDEVQAGNALLTSMVIDGGSIFLQAVSTIEDEISLDYQIPSATDNGAQLGFNVLIDPAPPGGSSYLTPPGTPPTSREISGYTLDLTGRPDDFGVYNTFYTILMARIDSSGRLINLSLDDSVFLETGFVDITADRGFGYLGKDTLASKVASKMELFKIVQSGNFDLEDVRFGMSIENFIGAPIDLYVNEVQSKKGNGISNLNWTGLGNKISVPPASLVNDLPQPSETDILIDASTSNIDELIELKPDSFLTDITAYINGSTISPDFDQFIFADYGIRSSFFIEIPLHLSASGLKLMDTVDFDYTKYDEDGQLQKGVLKLIAESNFPLDARVDLIILDEDGTETGTLTSADKLAAAQTDSEGRAVGATKSIAEYPLDAEKVELLKNASRLIFGVQLDSPSGTDKVRIYNTNYIELTLVGDLSIRTK